MSSELSTVYASGVEEALTKLKSLETGFILFGFSELSATVVEQQQQQQQQQSPKTLYIETDSFSVENTENEQKQGIYEKTRSYLTDSTVQYIVYKNNGTKYLFASWVGQRVKPMIKVKCSSHKDQLFKLVEKVCAMQFSAELIGINSDNHTEQINESFMDSKLFSDNQNNSAVAEAPKSAVNRYQPTSSSSTSRPSTSSNSRSTTNLAAQLRLVLSIDENHLYNVLQEQMKSGQLSWMTLAYNDNGVLSLTGSGSEQHQIGPSTEHLSETDINFVLYKWNMGTELGYGGDTEKILFVVWVGSRVNSIRRGKINQHKSKVYNFINKVFQLSGEYEVTCPEDLTNDIIKNRMLGNKTTTTALSSPRISGSPRIVGTPRSLPSLSSPRKLSSSNSTSSMSSPRLSDSLWNIAAVVPRTKYLMRKEAERACLSQAVASKKSLSTATNTIKVFASEQCADALEKFVGSDSKSVWALFGYNAGSKSELKLIETGTKEAEQLLSGSEALKRECTEESLSFIIVKVYVATKRGTRRIVAPKHILVTFKGSKLKPYFKVISANHAGKLKNTVAPIINVSDDFVTITSLSELDDLKKLFSRDEVIDDPALIEEINSNTSSSKGSFVKSSSGVPSLSSDLTFENEKEVQDAFKDLQSDTSETNWVIVKYADRRSLKYESKGNGGIEEFKPKLDDNQVQYVFFKLFIEELGGSAKIVLIAYVGKNVKMAIKASSTPDRISLFKYAESQCGVSSEFQANEIDEINIESILGKLTGSKGKTNDTASPTTSAVPRSKPQFGGKNQELKLSNEEAINSALKELEDDTNPVNFLLFGYDEQGANLELKQIGKDGMDGLRPLMKDNEVQYALLKLLVEETGYGGSPKITLISWVGENVAGMAKAKSSTHRLLLKEHCSKTLAIAAEYPVNLESDLNELSIRAKLTGSKGKVEQDGGAMTPSIGTAPRSATAHKKFGGKDGNLKFADENSVKESIERLKDNKSGIKWLMFGYTDPTQDFYTTSVVHQGSGAVSNFKPLLSKDTINYVVLRMSFMEYYEVIKVVLITFVGEDSPPFLKSLSAGHRVNLMEYMRKHLSIGGEFHPQDLEELTDQALLAKITGAKGGENVETLVPSDEPYASQKSSRWEPQREVRTDIEVKNKSQFSGEYKDIEFTGKDEIQNALKELSARSDVVYEDEDKMLDYIKLRIEGKGLRDVVVEEMGKGSLTDEWREKHLDVTKINVFIFAVSSTEGGTGMIKKFVFVQWNGANTKFLEKAQASELRQSLYNFCSKILFMGAEIQGCTLPEHVTQKLVMEKLTGSNVRGVETKVEKKQEKFKNLGKKKTALKYDNESAIYESLSKLVQLEDPEIDWMLVTYKENSIDELYLAHTGKGSVEEYKQYLTSTNMCYIVVKIMHAFGYAKDFEDTMSKPYYGLVHWKGSEVSVLEKALSSHHWNQFAKAITKRLQSQELAIQGSQYHAEHLEEVTLERIKKAMRLFD